MSAFHDANANGQLDTRSFLGIDLPSEGIGFSNDPEVVAGAPGWSRVAFTPQGPSHGLEVLISYL